MKKLKRFFALLICLLMISGTFVYGKGAYAAESANIEKFFISDNDNYIETMKNEVEPYIDSIKETGYMDVGEEDFKIYYEKYKVENSKASIVMVHGKGETLEVYHEMIYYFINSGYSVYGLELRGFGRSGRLGKKDDTQIDVGSFDDYVSDVKNFVDNVVVPESGEDKLYLFSHSMGGAVSAGYLEKYPDDFTAAVLSAPMFTMDTGKIPEWIAKIISDPSKVFPYGDEYVAGQGPYTEPAFDFLGTSSEARFKYYYDMRLEDDELSRGGVSYRWLQSALNFTKKTRGQLNASKVKTPVLLLQAGEDHFVKASGQNEFAKYAKNCTLVRMEEAKHEMYRERDGLLRIWLTKVLDFYDNNL